MTLQSISLLRIPVFSSFSTSCLAICGKRASCCREQEQETSDQIPTEVCFVLFSKMYKVICELGLCVDSILHRQRKFA